MNKSNFPYLTFIVLALIVFAGFIFRLYGILGNYSFWQDEAFVASHAREILLGKKAIFEGLSQYWYQALHLVVVMIFLKLFSFSEFAARLPSVFFGSAGIVAAYLLGTKLSNKAGGILAAFIYAFSQINLANSTQAKPYPALQTLLLFLLYFILTLDDKNKKKALYHLLIIFLCLSASLFHILGTLFLLPYVSYLLIKRVGKLTLFLLTILFFVLIYFRSELFPFNHLTYFRELFWKNYAFITLPAIFGFLATLKEKRNFSTGIFLMIFIYSYLWIFKYNTHNVRYVLPLFGLVFVYFSVFFAKVGDILFHKKSFLVCLFVIILLFSGGYRIIRKPQAYYNPNIDLYGDVQIADYKTVFKLIQQRFPNLSSIAIFTDWSDAQRWYLPQKGVDAYFLKGSFSNKPEPHILDKVMIYGNLKQFLKQKAKYKKGLLIVEDWESLLPEDIKQYAKKNMELEFRVEGLPQARGDNWPLEVYSWGVR